MSTDATVLDPDHWDEQYEDEDLPWETGRPATELRRVLRERELRPCRAGELGCGTGVNAVWLAKQGFTVTAIDLSERAIEEARQRAAGAGVTVDFRAGDLRSPELVRGPFDFFLDCGCYHAVRLADGPAYLRTLHDATRPGALGLVLMGNAAEPEDKVGPPVMTAAEVRDEWGKQFEIIQLRPFRFDAPRPGDKRYLGWSCLVRRPAD